MRAATTVVFRQTRLVTLVMVLESLALLGLLTTWPIAGIAAVVVIVVALVDRALRRASRQVDTILRETASGDSDLHRAA